MSGLTMNVSKQTSLLNGRIIRDARSLVRALALLMTSILATISPDTSLAQATPGYTLHAGDRIEVSVWREEELQREIMIRPDGRFSFPLTGEIVAAGRTVADIRAELTEKLMKYIPEAVVTVTVTGIDGNRIYVIGQVQNPGSFVMNPRINVLQALSQAGGTTPFAELNDIIVVRGSGREQRVFRFRFNDVSRGRDLEQNIVLESGDVIVVP
jgi:polysaccharide export outer membrane protein